jgi:outer membrane protein assembly factor BamB
MWSKAAPTKLIGTWADGDDLVIGDLTNVLTAYSLSSGALLWKRAVPGGGQLCSMSSNLGTGDIGVLFYSTDGGYRGSMQTITVLRA